MRPMSTHLSLAALFLSVASPLAYAQGTVTSSPTDTSNFSFKFKTQGRYSLYDTQFKNAMELISTTGRFGLVYKYKNVEGVVEAQMGSLAVTSTNNTSKNPGQQSMSVRKAYAAFSPLKTDQATLSLVVGRDRIAVSNVYSPDGLANLFGTNLDNASSAAAEDGISLKYSSKMDFGTIKATLGLYDNIAYSIQDSSIGVTMVGQADMNYGGKSKTQSRAYLAALEANVKAGGDGMVEGRFAYSNQSLAPTAFNASPSATAPISAQDVNALESSLGYNYMGGALKGGAWYQMMSLGKTQTCTSSSCLKSNDVTYTAGSTDDSQTINTVGVGFVGTSKLFDLTNLITDGDAFTYGAGYQNVTGQIASSLGLTGTTAVPINQYNVAVGYMQGVYNLELNYVMTSADKSIYTDGGSSTGGKTDNASMVYLSAVISL